MNVNDACSRLRRSLVALFAKLGGRANAAARRLVREHRRRVSPRREPTFAQATWREGVWLGRGQADRPGANRRVVAACATASPGAKQWREGSLEVGDKKRPGAGPPGAISFRPRDLRKRGDGNQRFV